MIKYIHILALLTSLASAAFFCALFAFIPIYINLSLSMPLGFYIPSPPSAPFAPAVFELDGVKYIKSIASGGHAIVINGHELTIDNVLVATHTVSFGKDTFIVPAGKVFAFTPHPRSRDSRNFGLINENNITYVTPIWVAGGDQ